MIDYEEKNLEGKPISSVVFRLPQEGANPTKQITLLVSVAPGIFVLHTMRKLKSGALQSPSILIEAEKVSFGISRTKQNGAINGKGKEGFPLPR